MTAILILLFIVPRNAKKTEDKVANLEEELKETIENKEKLNKDIEKLDEDATKVLEAFTTAQVYYVEQIFQGCSWDIRLTIMFLVYELLIG